MTAVTLLLLFYTVGGNCKLCFLSVGHTGRGGFAHSPHYAASKNIWRLFDVDKLPGEQKNKLVSLTLSVFFLGRQNSHRISSERRVEGTGYKLLLLHVREWMLWVLLVRQWKRERGRKSARRRRMIASVHPLLL